MLSTFASEFISRLEIACNNFQNIFKQMTRIQQILDKKGQFFQLFCTQLQDTQKSSDDLRDSESLKKVLKLDAQLVIRVCITDILVLLIQCSQLKMHNTVQCLAVFTAPLSVEEVQGLQELTYTMMKWVMSSPSHVIRLKEYHSEQQSCYSRAHFQNYHTEIWSDKLHSLFVWNNEPAAALKKRSWENQPFWRLTQWLHIMILQKCSADAAADFKNFVLSLTAAHHMWIASHYVNHTMSVIQKASRDLFRSRQNAIYVLSELECTDWLMLQLNWEFWNVMTRIEKEQNQNLQISQMRREKRVALTETLNHCDTWDVFTGGNNDHEGADDLSMNSVMFELNDHLQLHLAAAFIDEMKEADTDTSLSEKKVVDVSDESELIQLS